MAKFHHPLLLRGNFRAEETETGWGIKHLISNDWCTKPIFDSIDFGDKYSNYVRFYLNGKQGLLPISRILTLDKEIYNILYEKYYKKIEESLVVDDIALDGFEGDVNMDFVESQKKLIAFVREQLFEYGTIFKDTWCEDYNWEILKNNITLPVVPKEFPYEGNKFFRFKDGDIITFPMSCEYMVAIIPRYTYPSCWANFDGNIVYEQCIPIHLQTTSYSGPESKELFINPDRLMRGFFTEDYEYIYPGGGSFVELYKTSGWNDLLVKVINEGYRVCVCNTRKIKDSEGWLRMVHDYNLVKINI